MIKLSVVIITFNEERNLARCLGSVLDIADDIVVLDSFSTDKTEEIARRYGATFVQHAFDGHIEQKNRALTYAKHPYVLSLDADEALSPRLKKSIFEVKMNWQYDGYSFKRLTNYCGNWIRHTSWYPTKKLRLFDIRKGEWGGTNPHDRYILDNGAKRSLLKGDLLHYSYYTIGEHIDRITYFSKIVAEAYYKDKRKDGFLRIVFSPIWRLLRDYILKLGFLDGFFGLVISFNSAYGTFLKYVFLREMNMKESRKAKEKESG